MSGSYLALAGFASAFCLALADSLDSQPVCDGCRADIEINIRIRLPQMPGPSPGPEQPKPDQPKPEQPKPENRLNPEKAILRIRFGNAGCTATVIGPRRPDGRWDVLTAAHCVAGVGAQGVGVTYDGKEIRLRVTVHRTVPDVAWLVTEDVGLDLYYAKLAVSNPAAGTPVWHKGWGVDRPGNLERGIVVSGREVNGQLAFRISVSSGDSGSALFREDTNEVVGVVCCTREPGAVADVWGCSPVEALSWRPIVAACQDGFIRPVSVE